jgi:acyl-CoA thioesterase
MTAAVEPADLLAETTPVPVERTGALHRYTLALSRHWDFLLPSGGVVTTAALRAAEHAVGDATYRLVSATAIFCEPIQPGAIELDVDVLRAGGAAVQTRTHLRTPGSAGAQVLATFARDRPGPDVRGARMPQVPPPGECADLLVDDGKNPHHRAPFFRNVDMRLGRGDRLWTGEFRAGPARYARWFRYRRPQRDAAGRFDRLAHPPIADTMPAALTQALGPGPYRFYAPSLDLTLHVVDDTEREWVLVSAYVRRARAGWAIGEAELWDDTGRLLAFATQAMYVRTLTGEPPVRDATDPT